MLFTTLNEQNNVILNELKIIFQASEERSTMSEFEEDMTPDERIEIRGKQLEMAVDVLVDTIDEEQVLVDNARSEFLVRRAQAIADTLAIRQEIRAQLERG